MSKSIESGRPLVFLGVGIINTLLDFIFYTFLTSVVFDNQLIALAGFISGTFALICAFLTHGFITWRGSHIDHKTLLRFFLFTGFGMWVLRPVLLSLFIKLDGLYEWVYGITDSFGLPFSEEFVVNSGAFALMLVIVLAYNFYVYDRYVFKKKSSHTELENRSKS